MGTKGIIIGEAIRKLREEKGMTQTELAKAIGYESRAAISYLESGKRIASVDCIGKLSEALGVSPLYFFEIQSSINECEEFLPYLQKADERTLFAVRKLLGMPMETLDGKK